jgi:hypothetical protein
MPNTIGSCLAYAIYHSPLAFIRTLLELGANPNAPADDGFPPLIATLSSAQVIPGASRRTDVADVIRLLLSFGADPNQRGINDYTPLHMAVAERNPAAILLLLESGADPDLATQIDDCETPLEMARSAGLTLISELLESRGRPAGKRIRSGLTLLIDIPGAGDQVHRQQRYNVKLRLWLAGGRPVIWPNASGTEAPQLEGDPAVRVMDIRINRGSLIAGLFYGVEGMRIGGTRRLEIAPHLAYGSAGVPGIIPGGATLTAEITLLRLL